MTASVEGNASEATAQRLQLAAERPGSELVVVPECSHVPQKDKPAEFFTAVDAFLSDRR